MIEFTVSLKKDKSVNASIGSKVFEVSMLKKGDPGKTPIKGVDYFTEEDKAEILESVEDIQDIDRITDDEISLLF